MKLIILGMGCPRCAKLAASTKEAATSLGLDFTLEEITDKEVIAQYGGPALPALVVDGSVVSAGQVLEAESVKPLLKDPASNAQALKLAQAKEASSNRGRRVIAFVALVILVVLAIYAATADVKKKPNVPVVSGSAPVVSSTVVPASTVQPAPSAKTK